MLNSVLIVNLRLAVWLVETFCLSQSDRQRKSWISNGWWEGTKVINPSHLHSEFCLNNLCCYLIHFLFFLPLFGTFDHSEITGDISTPTNRLVKPSGTILTLMILRQRMPRRKMVKWGISRTWTWKSVQQVTDWRIIVSNDHDWLNGVLRRFQQYLSHIMTSAHIFHVFPGFHQ